MQVAEFETIVAQVQDWPPTEQAKLVKKVVEMLTLPHLRGALREAAQPLVYGKYRRTGQLSTEEDFHLAEWQPTEQELDGA